jgi:hypothetical protein
VISRNLGHGPTAYAAADIVTRRDSQKFRENSSLRCFAGGGRQFRNKFGPGGLSRGSDFSQTAIPPGSETGLDQGLVQGWPLLFCAETARYYHRLFAAT